jgi:hypothetical protein
MSDLVSILPEETRKHFINLKNVRDAHERELDAKRLDELNGIAAQKNLFHSGLYLKQRSELKTQFADALAYGYMEEALATCELYEVPLTRPFCALLEEAAKQMLTSFYRNIIQAQGTGVADFSMPVSAVQAVNQQASNKRFSIMPKIAVMIEAARVADEKKRAEDMANKTAKARVYKPPKRFAVGEHVRIINPGIDGVVTQVDDERTFMSQYMHSIDTKYGSRREPGSILELIPPPITSARSTSSATTFIQHINQTGPGSSVSQLGDTHTNILQICDMSGLKQELATIRAALKAQPESLETDEVLGSLASAERAAQSNDEHGVKYALSMITKGGWEIVKKVAPTIGSQVLLHYLKLHGMA